MVLWGAGAALGRYLEHAAALDDVIAVVDSDSARWGRSVGGFDVQDPSTLDAGSFDEIHITSGFIDSIRQTVAEIPALAGHPVVVPPKTSFNSNPGFSDERIRAAARRNLHVLQARLADDGVALVAIFGTCLGIVRDGDLIPWDSDIDLLVDGAAESVLNGHLAGLGWPVANRRIESMRVRIPTAAAPK